MAHTPFSLLIIRRLSLSSSSPKHYLPSVFHLISSTKPFSTSPIPSSSSSADSKPPPSPSSLSARLSFVFDQIDAIERDRSEKDDTLQRIRAWRESRKPQLQPEPEESELSKHGEMAISNSAVSDSIVVAPESETREAEEKGNIE